jgi:hypothetical protein
MATTGNLVTPVQLFVFSVVQRCCGVRVAGHRCNRVARRECGVVLLPVSRRTLHNVLNEVNECANGLPSVTEDRKVGTRTHFSAVG